MDSAERAAKFRPIFAALKEQDARAAAKLCDRKDIAQTPLAKALKAQAYLLGGDATGARDLALGALSKARTGSAVTDPVALLAAAKVLGRVGLAREATRAYEEAVAAAPESEPLARGLCLAYARVEDWNSLQSAALKAYRAASAAPAAAPAAADPAAAGVASAAAPRGGIYMTWAALALHQLASTGAKVDELPAPIPSTGGGRGFGAGRVASSRSPGADKLLLAERFLAKALDATPPPQRDADALGLYLHSLTRQGKAGEAYAALVGRYAYLPPPAASSSSSFSPTPVAAASDAAVGSGGAGADDAALTAEEEEEDAEAAAESAVEDAGAVSVRPDGRGGRGLVPGPMQPADQLRYAAQLLAWRAAWGPAPGEASPLVIPPPAQPGWVVVADPAGGKEVGTWAAAQAAFASLLTRIDGGAGEWDAQSGLAYCWARAAADALSPSAEKQPVSADAVRSLLAPVLTSSSSSSSSAPITGHAEVDAILRANGGDAPASGDGEGASSSSSSSSSLGVRRACMLSLILHQAVRCELAHRLSAGSGPAADAARAILDEGTAAYVALLASFVRAFSSKPSVFADLQTFLLPLVPGPAQFPAAPSSLSGFLSSEPSIVSLPFHPVGLHGSASETAPARSLFAWSFSVPSAQVESGLVGPVLSVWRATCRPDEALSASVKAALSGGRAAAVQAGLISKTDVMVRARDVSGGGGGGPSGAVRYDPRSPPADDPHGVAWALSARDEFVFAPEESAAIAAARGKVRRYTTAMQLLSYLGRTDLSGCAGAEAPGGPAEGAVRGEAGLRAVCAELTTAWENTLHLLAVSPAEAKEAGDGDDILLLAVHGVWELGLAHARARDERIASGGDGMGALFGAWTPGPASSPSASRGLYTSRAYFLEACALLEACAKHSAHNAQVRLALVRTYGWLCAPAALLAHAQALRVRYIAQETMGHSALLPNFRGHWIPALGVGERASGGGAAGGLSSLVRFLSDASASRPDYLRTALRCGNVASAADLARARSRLDRSASGAWARAAILSVELHDRASRIQQQPAELRALLVAATSNPDSGVDDSPEVLSALRDNEERDVQSCWVAPGRFAAAAADGSAVLARGQARSGGLLPARAAALAVPAAGKLPTEDQIKESVRAGLALPASVSTAMVADAALALFVDAAAGATGGAAGAAGAGAAPTSYLPAAARELLSWAPGSIGGASERLLRRAVRELYISVHAQTARALFYGARTTPADGTPLQARLALARLAAAFALAGCTVPGAVTSMGGTTGPDAATEEVCKSLEGVFAASQAEARTATTPHTAAALVTLRTALLGDWACGSLPIVDAGMSQERPAVRVAAASALWRSLAGLACVCDAAHGGLAAPAQAAALFAAAAHFRVSTSLAVAVLQAVATGAFEAAPPAAGAAEVSGGGGGGGGGGGAAAAPASAGTTTTTPLPSPALGGLGPSGPPPAMIAGARSAASSGGALRPAWCAEAPLALHHLMAPLSAALVSAARHTQSVVIPSPSGAAGAKGAAAKGAGKSAAADAASTPADAAALVASATAVRESLEACRASLRDSVTPLVASLNAVKAESKAVYAIASTSIENSALLVTAGWDITRSATPTVAVMRPQLGEEGGGGGGKGGKGGKGSASAGAAASFADPAASAGPAPSMSDDPGAAYLYALDAGWRKNVRVEGVEGPVLGLGAAWTVAAEGVTDAATARAATITAVRPLLK